MCFRLVERQNRVILFRIMSRVVWYGPDVNHVINFRLDQGNTAVDLHYFIMFLEALIVKIIIFSYKKVHER